MTLFFNSSSLPLRSMQILDHYQIRLILKMDTNIKVAVWM
jgi:hypothetical protein